MAKWCGKIVFAENVEQEPGVWVLRITERTYYGELVSNRWKRQNSGNVNDDLRILNDISIVADPYATEPYSQIVYAELDGVKWRVTDCDVQYPRLILTMGGVWNGESPGAAE